MGRFVTYSVLFVFLVFFLSSAAIGAQQGQDPAVADPQAQMTPEEKAKEEKQLKLYEDFSRFSDNMVARLNAMHGQGYKNIQVTQENGMFRGRYHKLEKKSSVVRESSLKPGEYSGILRYLDTVYECTGATKQECLDSKFVPVSGTSRGMLEIFKYSKGTWR